MLGGPSLRPPKDQKGSISACSSGNLLCFRRPDIIGSFLSLCCARAIDGDIQHRPSSAAEWWVGAGLSRRSHEVCPDHCLRACKLIGFAHLGTDTRWCCNSKI